MNLVGRDGGTKVKFSGGTYSAHPASLLAAKTFMAHLVAHQDQIYPYLTRLGAKTRQTVEGAFAQAGIYARCTGYGNDALPGSSINMLLFPYQQGRELTGPEETRNPAVCDITLSEKVLQLALLLEDVHVFHGLGSVTTAHTEADIDLLGEACRRVARRFKAHL
jgi:glutamate-1-semialdehyde 2,1-aminomutase